METVRTADERALAEARLIELPNHTTSYFPLPGVHGVNFYLLRMRRGFGRRTMPCRRCHTLSTVASKSEERVRSAES